MKGGFFLMISIRLEPGTFGSLCGSSPEHRVLERLALTRYTHQRIVRN